MNAGLRSYVLQDGDEPRLADFFGLSVRTVERWFSSDGQQYRRCVPLSFAESDGTIHQTVGQRIFRMFDPDDPDNGYGDGNAEGGTRIWQSLRLRCVLASCLGVAGGLFRSLPVYNGKVHYLSVHLNYLDECIHYINSVYTGNSEHAYFMQRAWVRFTIAPTFIALDANQTGWDVTIEYNGPNDGESDAEETEEDVPDSGDEPDINEV